MNTMWVSVLAGAFVLSVVVAPTPKRAINTFTKDQFEHFLSVDPKADLRLKDIKPTEFQSIGLRQGIIKGLNTPIVTEFQSNPDKVQAVLKFSSVEIVFKYAKVDNTKQEYGWASATTNVAVHITFDIPQEVKEKLIYFCNPSSVEVTVDGAEDLATCNTCLKKSVTANQEKLNEFVPTAAENTLRDHYKNAIAEMNLCMYI